MKRSRRAPQRSKRLLGNNGGLLSQAAGIPIIVFGPGTTELAHFPNESIDIEHVIEAAEIIAGTMVEWCEAAEAE
ncbi:hypothetical protein ACEQPO_04555 [Bacillus sp. SL00103]